MTTRKLVIKKLDSVKTGPRKEGKGNWTLYEVTAETENGTPITDKLKTFTEFEINNLIEVEIEKQEHETYGTSYLLKNVSKYATRKEMEDLAHRVSDLEDVVEGSETGSKTPKEEKTTPDPSEEETPLEDLPF